MTEESSYQQFEELFRQHHKVLCNLAFNIVRDEDVAKDVVQEVFFKLWNNRKTIDLEQQIKHYLFKATAHTSLNHLRFNKKIVRLDNGMPLVEVAAFASNDGQNYKELELRVRRAIEKLPPRCKTIYILSRHEGLRYAEIAEVLQVSHKTVENQMGIALQKLREELKPFLTTEFLMILLLAGLASLLFFI